MLPANVHAGTTHPATMYPAAMRPATMYPATSALRRRGTLSPLPGNRVLAALARAISGGVMALAIFSVVTASAQSASAQSQSVIYNFANTPDAGYPESDLVLDAAGNMYGTSLYGGVHGRGSVYSISPTGTETILYSFTGGADGNVPVAGVVLDKKTGNLYGTTLYGGTTGNGTVFEVTPGGTETVIYSFLGGADGQNPYSRLVRSGTTLYGTTDSGGAYGYGTVFKVTAAGKKTILHSFNSAAPVRDGAYPYAGLVFYKGLLYAQPAMAACTTWGRCFLSRRLAPRPALQLPRGRKRRTVSLCERGFR